VAGEPVSSGAEERYLSGKRPRWVNEWMDEAVLQFEAGNSEMADLCLRMLEGQASVNRDYAFRSKAATPSERAWGGTGR